MEHGVTYDFAEDVFEAVQEMDLVGGRSDKVSSDPGTDVSLWRRQLTALSSGILIIWRSANTRHQT